MRDFFQFEFDYGTLIFPDNEIFLLKELVFLIFFGGWACLNFVKSLYAIFEFRFDIVL